MEYALFTNNKKNVEIKIVDDFTKDELFELQSQGWQEVINVEKPTYNEEIEYLHRYINIEDDGSFKNVYVVKTDREKAINKITSLKQQLADTDYKVIKNMEAQLVNEELPYDSVTLHAERQALRDKINKLEELLKNN